MIYLVSALAAALLLGLIALAVRSKALRPYLDARLILFVALAAGASVISSHGALLFFRYLVDPWLAWVFILVVALGIIGLDAAGTLERGWRRAPYYAGMFVFLALETLANYFSGQAGFVRRIVETLPPSSDLRTIAEQHPAVTRSLVVLFLAMASIAVALFTFAAATRFGQLRSGRADRLKRAFAQLRTRYSTVVGALRAARATIQAQLAELATVRTMLAEAERVSAEAGAAIDAGMRQSAEAFEELRTAMLTVEIERDQLRTDAERAQSELERVRTALDAERQRSATERQQTQAELTEAQGIAAQLRAELEDARAASALDVRAIAQALRDEGVPLRTIGQALGVSEKSIRNWTTQPRLKEVA